MELRILGPFEVLDDDGAPVDVGGARPRTLLIDLALAQGHAVPADQLLEDIWRGERIPARNNLQVHVSRLRRVLGEDRIATRGRGYALDLPRDALDAARFDRLSAEGRAALHAGDAEGAATALRDALALWRGAALVDFADDAFARPVITRLEESRVAAIEDRVDADLLLGRHAELIGELEALVQEHPLRERLWAQLMTALYQAGRQADALRAYQRARTLLAEQLGIEPGPALRKVEEAVLAQDAALGSPQRSPTSDATRASSTNLPVATTALIGRETELDATATLVCEHRVATIVGPGGVGKTCLAIEIGRRLRPQFAHGVYLADLAPVGDAAGVAAAIAAALDVEVELGAGAANTLRDRVSEFLSGRDILLLLDNCEHVVAEAAALVELLVARCGGLHVLTTSREPLMIAGEVLWPLAPLDLADAMSLFTERARATLPSFEVTDEARPAVRELCERLDCLPLAIELAAARMRAFSPEDLLQRLDDRFHLLTVGARTAFPRQHTLRAVIDWSYDLLFDDERRLFERLSVFAGRFRASAAEAVCADETIRQDDVAELLARLVDKSLVTASETSGVVEFRLLQTLAQYGRERLEQSGDSAGARARHAAYVAQVVEVPDADHGVADGNWYVSVGEMLDDIRRAMEWAVEAGDADIACAIADGLGWFWNMGGRIDDAWRWITAALSLGETTLPSRRIRVLQWGGLVGILQDSERAIAYGAESVERARVLGDDSVIALATMLHASAISDFFHDTAVATELAEESRDAFLSVGDDWSRAMATWVSGSILLVHGDYDAALPELRDAAAQFGEIGNAWGRALALRHVADITTARGDYREAEHALEQAVLGWHAVGANAMPRGLTLRLANVYALEGRDDEADAVFDDAIADAERQRYVPTLALAYNLRGVALRRRNRLDEAERLHRAALQLSVDRGATAGLSLSHASLGYIAELRRDVTNAARQHRASLDAACDANDVRAQALALEGLAGVASLLGDDEGIGRYLGAAEVLRETAGGALVRAERHDVERALARVDDQAAMRRAFTEGCADPASVIAGARTKVRGS
ncbi:MAG TPA: BTAD domain-containing putative transcriptional regulator [Acidimicrobiia bacterium]|nr:BTAD domain-containing putative transcriptional regulator [Acidimicrobiia bacterium]